MGHFLVCWFCFTDDAAWSAAAPSSSDVAASLSSQLTNSSLFPPLGRVDPAYVTSSEPCKPSGSALPTNTSCTSATLLLSQSVSILYDNVVRSCGVGICSSCFSSNDQVINHMLAIHGLVPQEGTLYVGRQYLSPLFLSHNLTQGGPGF